MTFIADMNAIYPVRSLKVVGAQMFDLPNVWLAEGRGSHLYSYKGEASLV